MVQADLVNHTHWDREWYFTTMDALVLSDQVFTEVLTELEQHPEANFCLDGQVSIVDEYVDIHPEAKERIVRFVKKGQLFVGPWYTQTDALLPDAESILRNLIIGIRDTQAHYGKPMMVGYLPDTFGFNAQLPTLLHQVDIDNFVFWRGTNFKRQMNSVYFKWQGLSKKEVYAANFPFGYFTAQIDVETKRHLKEFVTQKYDPAVKFLSDHGQHQETLLPSGIDQMNIVRNMNQTVEKLNHDSSYHTVIGSYPDFITQLRQQSQLPHYQGELRLPTYARVHRTIGSVRHQIKTDNFKAEQKILRRVEPLMVIAHRNGVDIGRGLWLKLWKKLLECQAHDTLGGSVTDNVAVDIKHRFKEINELADGIENVIKKKLAEFLKLGEHDVLVFNTDTSDYHGLKTVEITAKSKNIAFNGLKDPVIIKSQHYPTRHHILMMTPRGREYTDEPEYFRLTFEGQIELPALGYKVIHFKEINQPALELSEDDRLSPAISWQDQQLAFKNDKLCYTNATRQIDDVLALVDAGNDGDTYDYSPLAGDHEQRLNFQHAHVKAVAGQAKVLTLTGMTKLPQSLSERTKANPKTRNVNYQLDLSFDDQGILNGDLDVDNQVYSHRLRLCLNPEINHGQTIAHIQNGFIKTQNQEIDGTWSKEFVEKPVNIYNFDKTVSIVNDQQQMIFFGKGMKEYQEVKGKLYITLMATTGQLGKPNLAWRPGRASGDTTNQGHIMMATPLAQELGKNHFEFALSFKETGFDEAQVYLQMHRWLAPSISYQKQKLNLFINRLDNKIWETENRPIIPEVFSLLNTHGLIAVAVYPSYSDSNAYILRIQNPTAKPLTISKDLLNKATVVNALEEPLSFNGIIDPYDMATLKFSY